MVSRFPYLQRGFNVWYFAIEKPSAAPSHTSDGKWASSVMREALMAVASVYDKIGIHGLPRWRYRAATTVATDQTAVA